MSEIVTLISNVGFPIACCILMVWNTKTVQEELTKAVEKLTDSVVALEKSTDRLFDEIRYNRKDDV